MDEFGTAAIRLAGLAGLLFGWRPDDFWGATPAELGAVVTAMAGEGNGLGQAEVEELKRMLGRGPSTGFAGPQHRVDHAPHGQRPSGGRPDPMLRTGED